MSVLDDDAIRALAEAGAAAPTGGNAQAWRVRASDRSLEIALDPARSGTFMDVDHASSLLGIGSFVENVAVVARSRGLEPRIEMLGLSEIDRPVARLTFSPCERADESLAILTRTRTTNRRPWNRETIAPERIEHLAAQTAADPAHRLVTVSGAARDEVADALAEADVVRTFNRTYMDEMNAEFRWTPEETARTRDGIDLDTLELSDGDRTGIGLMRKRWFVALFVTRNRMRNMGRSGLLASSHLCAVTMPHAARSEELLVAGRAVQRTWLGATQAGLSIQPWCTIPFFALRAERYPDSLPKRDLRSIEQITRTLDEAWGIAEDERPIFTFRLSIAEGPPSALALRRKWTDFTTIDRR